MEKFLSDKSVSNPAKDIQGEVTFFLDEELFDRPLYLIVEDGNVIQRLELHECSYVDPDYPHAGRELIVSESRQAYPSYCFNSGSTVITIVDEE